MAYFVFSYIDQQKQNGCPDESSIEQAKTNYYIARNYYTTKRQAVQQFLTQTYGETVNALWDEIAKNFEAEMENARFESPDTHNTVQFKTIAEHAYRAAEAFGRALVEPKESQQELDMLKQEISEIARNATLDAKQKEEAMVKEINRMFDQLTKNKQPNWVEQYFGKAFRANQQVTTDQLMGYAKSAFRNQLTSQMKGTPTLSNQRQHIAILYGYYREEAYARAVEAAIEHLGLKSMGAQVVGAQKTKIDILLMLTGGAMKASQDKDVLAELLHNLDIMEQNFSTEGTSNIPDLFVGVQAKPWDLTRYTMPWNSNTVGSKKELFDAFMGKLGAGAFAPMDRWHAGVLFLSNKMVNILGANTLLHAVGAQQYWTDDLIDAIIGANKFLSFKPIFKQSDQGQTYIDHYTSTIVLADHYCGNYTAIKT